MIRHIPNFLTLCNLACGCVGTVQVFSGNVEVGAFLIWAGAIFDFFDGFAARMLKSYSSIGKDLDSLADLVTFCFLPGTIIFTLISKSEEGSLLAYSGYLLVLFGALRLARFNTQQSDSDQFFGLPVPASGIFVSALPFIIVDLLGWLGDLMINGLLLAGTSVMLSLLMVSTIPLLSLKFKNFSFTDNWYRYVLLLISLILLVIFKFVALPMIIILYVVFSAALNIRE